jgi:hypothetical protein
MTGGQERTSALEGDRLEDRALAHLGENRGRMVVDRHYGKRRHAIDEVESVEPRHERTEVSEDVPH